MGIIELGLTDEVFWSLTPRLFAKLCEQFRLKERRADRRAGEVVSMLYNLKRDTKTDPAGKTWEDVFPDSAKEQRVQTDEEMFLAMKAWAVRTVRTKASN